MIVKPSLLKHPKFQRLETLAGAASLASLIRMWCHCEDDQRGEHWTPNVKNLPAYIEQVCEWKGEPGKLCDALVETGFVVLDREGIRIHDWDDWNHALVSKWKNGKRGGRKPKSESPPAETESAARFPRSTPPSALSGVEWSGVESSGVERERAPRFPTPTFDQVLAHGRKVGWPYSSEEMRLVWLEFEGSKLDDGSWRWGKHPVTDWRHVVELRLAESRKETGPNISAVNGRLVGLDRRIRELEKTEDPNELVELRKLREERAQLVEQQKKAAQTT